MFRITLLTACVFSYFASASPTTDWIASEKAIALARLQSNISPAGSTPGVIIASPSRQDPDYYFHWIRDSALVVDALLQLPPSQIDTKYLNETFADYVTFSRQLQGTPTSVGLGEPRYNVDGTVFTGPWARPQNDGPALRVLTLYRGMQRLHTNSDEIQKILQSDLNYILKNFRAPCFDLWEEVRGDHFYTRLVQRAALRLGLKHYNSSWNFSRADLQRAQTELGARLDSHWIAGKKYFSVSQNRVEGAEAYKFTDLDTAVVLGALHAQDESGKFSFRDDRILATAVALEDVFQKIYAVNSLAGAAPAIGRYSDDVYFGGNPWYLTTAAFAELHYRLAASLKKEFRVTENNLVFLQRAMPGQEKELRIGLLLRSELRRKLREGLKARGDLFMERLKLHTPPDGGMAEQFARTDGKPVSARDLTWSYASFLTAAQSR